MFLLVPSTLLAKYTAIRISPASNIIISHAVVVLFVLMATSGSIVGFNACLMERILDLPCPGCGVITGLNEFFQLNFSKAFQSNPCSLIIGAGMFISLALAVLIMGMGKQSWYETLLKLVRKGNIILAFALIINYFITIIKIHHLWL